LLFDLQHELIDYDINRIIARLSKLFVSKTCF
jgi:hypothetical protein